MEAMAVWQNEPTVVGGSRRPTKSRWTKSGRQ
jgi:hypothetical protein